MISFEYRHFFRKKLSVALTSSAFRAKEIDDNQLEVDIDVDCNAVTDETADESVWGVGEHFAPDGHT